MENALYEYLFIIINCVLAHCRCKNAAENFLHHVTETLCQNYSLQDFVQDSRALKALAFRTACVEYPSSMLAIFRVRERNYLTVRFIFRISEVREFFFLAGEKPAYRGSPPRFSRRSNPPEEAKRWLVDLKRPAFLEFLWSLSFAPITLRKLYLWI